MTLRGALAAAAALALAAPSGAAGEADVLAVEVEQVGETQWRFDVTVRHDDEGWDHYVDLWVVETPDGRRLGERVLAHPHVEEMPFTRAQTIDIPPDVGTVVVRARDSVHGFGGAAAEVTLPRAASPPQPTN